MPAFQKGGHTGRTQSGVPNRRSRGKPLQGLLRSFASVGEILFQGTGFDFRHLLEVSRSYLAGLERKSEVREPLQRGRETIDGVVSDGHRAVTAFVPHLKAEIDYIFFADLEIVGDFLALGFFTPAAVVESELGIDEIA